MWKSSKLPHARRFIVAWFLISSVTIFCRVPYRFLARNAPSPVRHSVARQMFCPLNTQLRNTVGIRGLSRPFFADIWIAPRQLKHNKKKLLGEVVAAPANRTSFVCRWHLPFRRPNSAGPRWVKISSKDRSFQQPTQR